MRVLEVLAAKAGRIVPREEIFAQVWPRTAVTDDSLTQCIADIRRALGPAGKTVLETIPRRGFRLHPDSPAPRRPAPRIAAGVVVAVALVFVAASLRRPADPGDRFPTLSIAAGPGTEVFAAELGAALDRYGSLERMTEGARFAPHLSQPSGGRLSAELSDTTTYRVLLARSIPDASGPEGLAAEARRLATDLASPASGAIARTLFATARQTRPELLTPYECYLHYFQFMGGQAGERAFLRAQDCLQTLVEASAGNARAQALLGATYVEQYWYGTGLDLPESASEDRRAALAARALEAVRLAEAAAPPADPEIQIAIAMSYYANCQREKMTAALHRAIERNPFDPRILGIAGNWLSYVGNWEEGVPLAARAIALSQPAYERWWYWPVAKKAWLDGDYEAALDGFMRGYSEDEWHTHLAYTLPLLGRMEEARAAVGRLQETFPGFTRTEARRSHERWCFDDDFIARMDAALALAGLPEGPDRPGNTARPVLEQAARE